MRAFDRRRRATHHARQWAVLAKVERTEGLKQSELAELMEMQPITLTRLIDKLCDNGWIERRGDEKDRRVNRLYLRKAARPLLGKLAGLRSELTATALDGINPADAHRLLAQLDLIKENVRNAISPVERPPRKEHVIAIPCSNFAEQKGIPLRIVAAELAASRAAADGGMRRYRRSCCWWCCPCGAGGRCDVLFNGAAT